ncbi:DUF2971 domain-containing protein [Spirochaeta cellobiosiphila]|uniref:DUF2971 domain-containing protein n=1 Tax=Spirochaeta cellobiosiphila TaxID=504483 RepID=UPI0004283480|nr:DUF2971 domain-containing protein [Spirochaeta cellobiosiphila]
MDNEYFYRFRPIEFRYEDKDGKPIKKCVSEELRNQEIALCTVSENNDPMDGLMSIYWEGDAVLWKNLIKHYALCLFDNLIKLPLYGNDVSFSITDVKISLTPEDFRNVEIKNLFETYLANVLTNKNINFLKDILIKLHKVNQSTMKGLLGIFQEDFSYEFSKVIYQSEFSKFYRFPKFKTKDKSSIFYFLENEDELNLESISNVIGNIEMSSILIQRKENKEVIPISKENYINITLLFHNYYIKACNRFVFPIHYLASFSKHYSNITMWGHYASGHRGICLVFKKDKHLKLTTRQKLPFKEVIYEDKAIEMNFFTSLAALSLYKIDKYWLEDGNSFSKYEGISVYDSDSFRDDYWSRFNRKTQTKTESWSSEQEVRVVFSNHWGPEIEYAARIKQYDFDCLDGIIFGIKTPDKVKIDIISVVENILKERRDTRNFNFYQAEIDLEKYKMKYFKLNISLND